MKWEPRFTVLLDTNLLVLSVVGSTDISRVGSIGGTEQFDAPAFELLKDLLGRFRYAVTTPHVLAETSNLVCRGAHSELANELRSRLRTVSVFLDERFVYARKLSKDALAWRFGLADTAIIEAAKKGCCVLSVDLDLCGELSRRGLSVINFNHLRFPEVGR